MEVYSVGKRYMKEVNGDLVPWSGLTVQLLSRNPEQIVITLNEVENTGYYTNSVNDKGTYEVWDSTSGDLAFSGYCVFVGEVDRFGIMDGEVVSAKIATSAVTNSKIADNAVTTDKISDDSITLDKMSGIDTIPLINSKRNQAQVGEDIQDKMNEYASSPTPAIENTASGEFECGGINFKIQNGLLISSEVTNFQVSGGSTITIPADGSVSESYDVDNLIDQYGLPFRGSSPALPIWSLVDENGMPFDPQGVTFDTDTATLFVDNTAEPVTVFVQADIDGVIRDKEVVIQVEE